jgi:glycosyltransferase involved in cell wall biosynthesis
VGGNARDYPTLMKACRSLPHIRFYCVVRPHNLSGLDVPANVEVKVDATLDEVNSIVERARLMVIPLTPQAPCGHVTIVSSFFRATPVIATRSDGITDYIVHGENGLLTEPGSSNDLAQAIDAVWKDKSLAQKLGNHAREFAQTLCSEQNYIDHFSRVVQSIDGSTSITARA